MKKLQIFYADFEDIEDKAKIKKNKTYTKTLKNENKANSRLDEKHCKTDTKMQWIENIYASLMIMPNGSSVAGNLKETIMSIISTSLLAIRFGIVSIFISLYRIQKCIGQFLNHKGRMVIWRCISLHRKLDSMYLRLKSVAALSLLSYIVALKINNAKMSEEWRSIILEHTGLSWLSLGDYLVLIRAFERYGCSSLCFIF